MSRKLSRWRWLKRAFYACLFLLVLLVSVAYYKLPPLAESAIRDAINSEDFLSREFKVTKVGPTETILEEVDIASPGWRLQTPKVTTTYTWQDVQNARLSDVDVSQGTLTLDFDATGTKPSGEASPKEAPKAVPGGSQSILPFDQLQARDLTLVLRREGREMRLRGTVSVMDGQLSEAVQWRFDLSQEKHRIRGKGTLNAARLPESVSLRSSNPEIEAWLAFLGIEAGYMEGVVLEETDIRLNRADSKSDWAATARVLGGFVDQSSFSAELGEIELSTTIESDTHFVARGSAQILGIEAGAARLGALESSFEFTDEGKGWLQLEDRPVLTVGQFAVPVGGKVAFAEEGRWSVQLHSELEEELIAGRSFDDFELSAASTENGAFAFAIPKLGVDMVTLEDISGEMKDDTLTLTASHFVDYGQGEIYGPVPVSLNGESEKGTWKLKVEAKTLPSQPWQAYWEGLGFSLHGLVRADWKTDESKVTLSAELSSADLRRNESAVVLKALDLKGSYETEKQALDVQLKGESAGQAFTGGLASVLEGDTRRFNYEISKLKLPENTILGAFAEALKEMPMSAFLDGTGEVVLPPEKEKAEHRLRLKLARGVYRHPERKLAGQGIAGTFAIESFSPFITVDDQRAAFGRWRMGDLELTQGTFLYKLGPQGAVLIKEAEALGIGGRLTMKSLASHPGDPDFESVVTFDKIDLGELAKIIPGFEGKVGGQVSGQLHLRFRDGILSLPLGSLALNEGSKAYLRLNAKEALGAQLTEMVDDPTALQIVESALKDLVVKELEIGFFDPENEDSVCRIRLKGHSREEVPIPNTQGKGKAIAPIHLNINVDDPSEIVRRLLNFGLRKQLNTRLKPGG